MTGSTAVTLTANRTAAAAPMPGAVVEARGRRAARSRRPTAAPRRRAARRSRPPPSRGLAEDREARSARARGRCGACAQPARDARRARRQAGAQQRRGDEHGGRARANGASGVPAPAPAGGRRRGRRCANITAPRITSARRLSSVWETSVPSTTGRRLARPARAGARRSARARARRAGRAAWRDISTPIEVALQRVGEPRPRVGQRGAQDRVPGDGAQDHRGDT